jgi:DNA-directed RNA polymerase specialized sigma24 family protein
MTTLDDLLYAWLAESDESRFERAFNAYFAVAFPALIRHLARTAPSDPGVLEEIAQDALLKFFERIGRGRRLASDTVVRALDELQPLPLGPFHARGVGTWRIKVGDYQSTVMRFRPQLTADGTDSAWKATVRELAQRIPPLQSRGWQLIDHVRLHLRWDCTSPPSEPALAVSDAGTAGFPVGEDDHLDSVGFAAPLPATVDFADAVTHAKAAALATEAELPGTNRFVQSAVTVIDALPRLRVPTNGYLFETAMSLYLDEYRRRGRQKRGGVPVRQPPTAELADGVDAGGAHPLDQALAGDFADAATGHEASTTDGRPGPRLLANSDCAASDSIRQWEEAEFFERFYAYLRAPVVAAEEAYEAALLRGRAAAHQRKRDALAHKLARTLAVIAAIGEGYTQEETAQRLDISRNQVKYVIEQLQEAYSRFTADCARMPSQRASGGVSAHAD